MAELSDTPPFTFFAAEPEIPLLVPPLRRGVEDRPGAGDPEKINLYLESQAPAADDIANDLIKWDQTACPQVIGGDVVECAVHVDSIERLIGDSRIIRIQTAKTHSFDLDRVWEYSMSVSAGSQRTVEEDGSGTLVAVIDTGFDLSHPAFQNKDKALRVEGLLDQLDGGKSYDTSELEKHWNNGKKPGDDLDGHGTHVASIAAGSRFSGPSEPIFEGIASGARMLLVRTDRQRIGSALQWIGEKAGTRPCVVNMSFGHDYGSHDGTDTIERTAFKTFEKPGRILVVAAGNSRGYAFHCGGYVNPRASSDVPFEIRRGPAQRSISILTLWHSNDDEFGIELHSPQGIVCHASPLGGKPAINVVSGIEVAVSRDAYPLSDSVQTEIQFSFDNGAVRDADLSNWKLRVGSGTTLRYGRFDAWFAYTSHGRFGHHELVGPERTVSMPGTSRHCITVGSYVSRTSAFGAEDRTAVIGRASSFSSMGPTRDGRLKPDCSAPGQFVIAALAARCRHSDWRERAEPDKRLLCLEGTSMSAPVVTGAISLLLQRRPQLTTAQAIDIISASANQDWHTGFGAWGPLYGVGKINIVKAIHLCKGGP